MNHESSCISRLVVYVKTFHAESPLVPVPVLFRDEEPSQRGTLAARAIAEAWLLGCAATTRPMHGVGRCHYPPFLEIPDEEPWLPRGNGIVDEKCIMLVHPMTLRKGKSLLSTSFNGLILPSVGQFGQAIVFPCPLQTEQAGGRHHRQHRKGTAIFPFPNHPSLLFCAAMNTAMVAHSSTIST